jgi:hypothetical protein
MSLLGSWSEASFTHPRGAIQMAKNLSNAIHTYFTLVWLFWIASVP